MVKQMMPMTIIVPGIIPARAAYGNVEPAEVAVCEGEAEVEGLSD